MLKNLVHVSQFNAGLLKKMLEAIPDEKMCNQPTGLPNHPAWQVGHLTMVRSMIAKQLGATDAALPETWSAQFGRNSTPSPDRAAYPSKSDLLATFDRGHGAAIRAISSVTPERLASAHTNERLLPMFPTVADLLIQMMVGHDGLHVGQLADWRRVMGYPRVL